MKLHEWAEPEQQNIAFQTEEISENARSPFAPIRNWINFRTIEIGGDRKIEIKRESMYGNALFGERWEEIERKRTRKRKTISNLCFFCVHLVVVILSLFVAWLHFFSRLFNFACFFFIFAWILLFAIWKSGERMMACSSQSLTFGSLNWISSKSLLSLRLHGAPGMQNGYP